MQFIFDLDGTLIDNHSAITAAYAEAGVVIPDMAHGLPVGDWCTPAQHITKQRAYPAALKQHAKHGPAWGLWRWCVHAAHAVAKEQFPCIITGASEQSAYDALQWLGIPSSMLLPRGYGLTPEKKAITIRDHFIHWHNRIVYVDADAGMAQIVAEFAGCGYLVPCK
jgi:hypothetical protein